MNGEKSLIAWMRNRVGLPVDPSELPHFVQDSIEHNQSGHIFTSTFGQKNFWGFIGFIDLRGYSSFSQDKTPEEISLFVKPFLSGVIKIITENNGLIDKTIGDEVMFVLPQIEGGAVAYFEMYAIVRLLREFSESNNYKFRIGMSYGDMFLDVVETNYYTEWFVSGEPIIVAKRLMSLDEVEAPEPSIMALGMRQEKAESLEKWAISIEEFPPCGWKRSGEQKMFSAKGIGDVCYQIMEKYKPNLNYN